jgi:hypothetical protein
LQGTIKGTRINLLPLSESALFYKILKLSGRNKIIILSMYLILSAGSATGGDRKLYLRKNMENIMNQGGFS